MFFDQREFIEEKVYPASFDHQRLMVLTQYTHYACFRVNCAKALDDFRNLDLEMAEELAPHFIQGRPNAYTFTKSIAECLVASEATDIPAIIVRPSTVGPTWSDPIPGWVDNFNGRLTLIRMKYMVVLLMIL